MIDELLCILQKFFYWCIESLLDILGYIVDLLVFLLPTTPFVFEQLEWGEFGLLIGYFFPVSSMIQHFVAILLTIASYYAVRYLLRTVKMIK